MKKIFKRIPSQWCYKYNYVNYPQMQLFSFILFEMTIFWKFCGLNKNDFH